MTRRAVLGCLYLVVLTVLGAWGGYTAYVQGQPLIDAFTIGVCLAGITTWSLAHIELFLSFVWRKLKAWRRR